MELKSYRFVGGKFANERFNRTFMELKSELYDTQFDEDAEF